MVCGLRSAVCSLQSAVCGLQSAVCSLQSANVIHRPHRTVQELVTVNLAFTSSWLQESSMRILNRQQSVTRQNPTSFPERRETLGTRFWGWAITDTIGHFRVPENPHIRNEAECTTFLVKMSFICMRIENHFNIKGWAPNLVLIQRPGGTLKWPITRLKKREEIGSFISSSVVYVLDKTWN